MTLTTKTCTFIHLPKTGGTFLRKVLSTFDDSAIDHKKEGWHLKLDNISDDKLSNFTISIVRNPISWYESIWKHIHVVRQNNQNWGKYENHPIAYLDRYYSEIFSEFITNVITNEPGYYSKVLKEYIGENYDDVDYIAKTETLYSDAAFILDRLNIKFNGDNLRKISKSSRNSSEIKWANGQKNLIKELEHEMIEHFYKDSPYI